MNPKPATLRKLAGALGVQWYSLMSDEWEERYGYEAYREEFQEHLDKIAVQILKDGIASDIDRLIVLRQTYKHLYRKLNAKGQREAFELLLNYSDVGVLDHLLHDMKELVDDPQFQKKPEE